MGLELAENGGYDLILLDVMLPGLSGLELLRRCGGLSQCPSSCSPRATR